MLYMDITHHPLANATRDLIAIPGRTGMTRRGSPACAQALALRQNTPYALSSGISGVTYEICCHAGAGALVHGYAPITRPFARH